MHTNECSHVGFAFFGAACPDGAKTACPWSTVQLSLTHTRWRIFIAAASLGPTLAALRPQLVPKEWVKDKATCSRRWTAVGLGWRAAGLLCGPSPRPAVCTGATMRGILGRRAVTFFPLGVTDGDVLKTLTAALPHLMAHRHATSLQSSQGDWASSFPLVSRQQIATVNVLGDGQARQA